MLSVCELTCAQIRMRLLHFIKLTFGYNIVCLSFPNAKFLVWKKTTLDRVYNDLQFGSAQNILTTHFSAFVCYSKLTTAGQEGEYWGKLP